MMNILLKDKTSSVKTISGATDIMPMVALAVGVRNAGNMAPAPPLGKA
ncbi:MAG: hypothetical protein JNK21_16325 [Rhodospirillaceae bacterium]|nr:hypothetical protein [Rhodospirillaceae bacterium]